MDFSNFTGWSFTRSTRKKKLLILIWSGSHSTHTHAHRRDATLTAATFSPFFRCGKAEKRPMLFRC